LVERCTQRQFNRSTRWVGFLPTSPSSSSHPQGSRRPRSGRVIPAALPMQPVVPERLQHRRQLSLAPRQRLPSHQNATRCQVADVTSPVSRTQCSPRSRRLAAPTAIGPWAGCARCEVSASVIKRNGPQLTDADSFRCSSRRELADRSPHRGARSACGQNHSLRPRRRGGWATSYLDIHRVRSRRGLR
jgi:hypothetical protein